MAAYHSSSRPVCCSLLAAHCLLPKTGAQGRIRTSVAHSAADLQSAAINHSATCASPLIATPYSAQEQPPALTRTIKPKLLLADTARRGRTSRYNQTSLLCFAENFWSWRRDLNPRPPDYKSGALPAELRQPATQNRAANNQQRSLNFITLTPPNFCPDSGAPHLDFKMWVRAAPIRRKQ